NPRFVSEKVVDTSALVMGATAENLHDRYPELTKERSDAFAAASQAKVAAAYAAGRIQQDLVPMATRSREKGWGLAVADEPPRATSRPGPTSATASPPCASASAWAAPSSGRTRTTRTTARRSARDRHRQQPRGAGRRRPPRRGRHPGTRARRTAARRRRHARA